MSFIIKFSYNKVTGQYEEDYFESVYDEASAREFEEFVVSTTKKLKELLPNSTIGFDKNFKCYIKITNESELAYFTLLNSCGIKV